MLIVRVYGHIAARHEQHDSFSLCLEDPHPLLSCVLLCQSIPYLAQRHGPGEKVLSQSIVLHAYENDSRHVTAFATPHSLAPCSSSSSMMPPTLTHSLTPPQSHHYGATPAPPPNNHLRSPPHTTVMVIVIVGIIIAGRPSGTPTFSSLPVSCILALLALFLSSPSSSPLLAFLASSVTHSVTAHSVTQSLTLSEDEFL
jgi:hypothetical protein